MPQTFTPEQYDRDVAYWLSKVYGDAPPQRPKKKHHHQAKTQRNQVIISRHKAGETIADLADEFGISVQRVHQILTGKHR